VRFVLFPGVHLQLFTKIYQELNVQKNTIQNLFWYFYNIKIIFFYPKDPQITAQGTVKSHFHTGKIVPNLI
jgi:predicted AAA+ superfamily ATPase